MRALTLAAALAALSPLPATSQQWMQTADPQLVGMLDQILMTYQSFCNQGNPQACQLLPGMQQQGLQILEASYACMAMQNTNACQFYQMGAMQVQQMYMQMNQYVAAPPMQGGTMGVNPLGDTHADRMATIEQFGQQSMTDFNNRMTQMDSAHQQFMQTLQ